MSSKINTFQSESTMARHGTLPEFIYQRNLIISEKLWMERVGNANQQDCENLALAKNLI